jgi:hypothetical protein
MQPSFRVCRCVVPAVTLAAACLSYSTHAAEKAEGTPATNHGLPLVFEENFENGADRWEPKSPDGWKMAEEDGKKFYSQHKNIDATKSLPHRSPWNIALLKDLVVGDMVLEVKVRQTSREYPHRDSCIVFGYQDPAHLYYVHFGSTKNDPNANQVFIVNAADRKKITEQEAQPIPWGAKTDWHKVKIVRKVDDGLIEAYFDDMEKPIEVAHDKNFKWGRIGIGTFDDTADFAEVKVWAIKVKPPMYEGVDGPRDVKPANR